MFLNVSPVAVRSSFGKTLLNVRNRHLFFFDLIIFLTMPALSLYLRVESNVAMVNYMSALALYTLLAVIIRSTVFYFMGLYRRYWRYASVEDLVQVGLAVLFSSLLVILAYVVLRTLPTPERFLPRSVPIMDALLVGVAVTMVRFSLRLADRWRVMEPSTRPQRVGIMGAGSAGVMILREIRRNPALSLLPVCFFDDDPSKQNMEIHGVPVRGSRDSIPDVVEAARLDLLILAMPTAPGRTIRELSEICQSASVKTKTIPGIYELLDGRVSISQLRNIELTDLLRRRPVQTDIAAVQTLLRGKRVLVTGGGGSIGGELSRQILACDPAQLVLLGHGENSIFESERALRRMQAEYGHEETEIIAVIADIRFTDRIKSIFARIRPEVVFHAAAHKHVPLMELNPVEAITNNVLGTRNVVEAAATSGVEQFVMISTDKAVNPTNVMGASKRAAELVVLKTARAHNLPYVAVRFGNVLGSRGSVVPIFQRQIEAGGPVTVTHPEIRRYFMTIPEAVQLVLQASVLGRSGEVFVLDMGDPVYIADMAKTLIRLSGYEVGRDIEIEFTGLRPGEKLFEELFIEGESYGQTDHAKIFAAFDATAQIPYDLDVCMDALESAAKRDDRRAIITTLKAIVPEYSPQATASSPTNSASPASASLVALKTMHATSN